MVPDWACPRWGRADHDAPDCRDCVAAYADQQEREAEWRAASADPPTPTEGA